MKVDDAIAKLLKAKKRLEPEQGRIARRNARTATLAALAAVRKALDEEFPAIAKPRRIAVSMSKEAVQRRAKRKLYGYVKIELPTVLRLHECGVKTVRRPSATAPKAMSEGAHYGPRWAVDALRAKVEPAQIKKAIRSPKERKKIEAYIRLGGGAT